MWPDVLGIILLCHCAQSFHTNPKARNETGIKLYKSKNLSHVADQLWGRPRLEQLMFGLGWAISLGANIDTNKLEAKWEEVAFA